MDFPSEIGGRRAAFHQEGRGIDSYCLILDNLGDQTPAVAHKRSAGAGGSASESASTTSSAGRGDEACGLPTTPAELFVRRSTCRQVHDPLRYAGMYTLKKLELKSASAHH